MQTEPTPAQRAANGANDSPNISAWAWLLAIAGHTLFVVVVYAALYAFGLLYHAPSAASLSNWDVGWYDSIRVNGYVSNSGAQSNLAFFPLFPYLWRLTGLDAVGMSAVNAGLFLLGSVWLGRTFGLRRHQLLLLLSVPSLFFCLVPYAEALFFLFGAVLLRGMHRRHLGLTVLGLLGCCLTRSAATLFVPAYILSELLACTGRAELPRLAKRLAGGLLAIGAALAVVMYLHYQASNDPLAFFSAQKFWAHELHGLPQPPLHSAAGTPVLGFDLLALFSGLLSIAVCIGLGIRWVRGWRGVAAVAAPSRAVIFSLCYCAGIAAVVLLYQDGDLANCSRYILSTPFFGVLLAQLPQWQYLKRSSRWLFVGSAGAIALGVALWCGWPARFSGFMPGEAHFFFACWVGYLAAYVLAFSNGRYGRELRTGLYVANAVCQAMLLNFFLGGAWVG